MPTSATTHIQKIAPGPPSASAMATPAMFPVPTRELMPMQKAWKELMPPWLSPRDRAMTDTIRVKSRAWTPRVRTVKYSPAPTRSATST